MSQKRTVVVATLWLGSLLSLYAGMSTNRPQHMYIIPSVLEYGGRGCIAPGLMVWHVQDEAATLVFSSPELFSTDGLHHYRTIFSYNPTCTGFDPPGPLRFQDQQSILTFSGTCTSRYEP